MKVHSPAMKFVEPNGEADWLKCVENNQDPYGDAVIRFCSEWATRMEAAIDAGETIEQCIDNAGRAADDEGITTFMYGCAVKILSRVWLHGEKLRRHHNLSTQIHNEGEIANESGGVLNPALINIQPKNDDN